MISGCKRVYLSGYGVRLWLREAACVIQCHQNCAFVRWNVNKMWSCGQRTKPLDKWSDYRGQEGTTQRNRYDLNMISEAHKTLTHKHTCESYSKPLKNTRLPPCMLLKLIPDWWRQTEDSRLLWWSIFGRLSSLSRCCFDAKCVIGEQVRPNRGLLFKGTICWSDSCTTTLVLFFIFCFLGGLFAQSLLLCEFF